MLEIGNMGILPTDKVEEYFDELVGDADLSEINFNAEDYLSESTIEAGYDSSNAVLNNFFNFILISVVLAVFILIGILRIICYRVTKVSRCLHSIWRKIFWNFIIRSTLETFLELCLTNMIKMFVLDYSTWYEIFGTCWAITVLVLLALFSFTTPLFLYNKRNRLDESAF